MVTHNVNANAQLEPPSMYFKISVKINATINAKRASTKGTYKRQFPSLSCPSVIYHLVPDIPEKDLFSYRISHAHTAYTAPVFQTTRRLSTKKCGRENFVHVFLAGFWRFRQNFSISIILLEPSSHDSLSQFKAYNFWDISAKFGTCKYAYQFRRNTQFCRYFFVVILSMSKCVFLMTSSGIF